MEIRAVWLLTLMARVNSFYDSYLRRNVWIGIHMHTFRGTFKHGRTYVQRYTNVVIVACLVINI